MAQSPPKYATDEFLNSLFQKSCRDRLMKEVYIHFSLNHPNIVKFYGLVFETGNQGKCGFVLEFMTNGDLLEYFINKRPNLSFKLRLLHDVASGMEYLHTRIPPIIHGDLKMNNILISDDLHAKVFIYLCRLGIYTIGYLRGHYNEY